MKILVSACLMGAKCRFDGKSQPNDRVLALTEKHTLIPVCPEIYGGLPTPRKSAEIEPDSLRVVTADGNDVTEQYRRGAEEVARLASVLGCRVAVLKERSPSCGVHKIHNGCFDGGIIPGMGVTASMLCDGGMEIYSEEDTDVLDRLAESESV